MVIQERYMPVVVGVNATVNINNQSVAGFVCQTAGTVTLTTREAEGVAAFNILTAFPVVAGTYYPLPFFIGKNGGTFTAAGGASGTLAV